MPFGLVFGALFFGLCVWLGLTLAVGSAGSLRAGGLGLALAAGALAFALLRRHGWARWGGIGLAGLIAVLGLRLAAARGGAVDLMLLAGAATAALLLVLPATAAYEPRPGERGTRRVLQAVTAAGLALALAGWWSGGATPRSAPPSGTGALPASAIVRGVPWTDYGTALDRAGREGKLVLATFVTGWCGYCRKMSREVWRSPEVVERLQDFVPARVDVEERTVRAGFSGQAAAARHRIEGFPAQLLLDSQGRELARADGYQSASQFLRWLDAAAGPRTALDAAGRSASR